MQHRIGLGFSNCLGNFLIMTAALKILRERTHDAIIMVSDDFMLARHPAMKALAEKLFDDVVTKYTREDFDEFYVGDWSCPKSILNKGDTSETPIWWTTGSQYLGMHEVQIYLNMIGAKSSDFSGFMTSIAEDPVLEGDKIRIALANSSISLGSRQGKKTGWCGFSALSEALIQLGYEVILVGKGDELKDCAGLSFVDKLDIFGTAKVLSQCDLVVSTDNGLMHLADSLGIPLVVLVGPTPMTKSHPLVSPYRIVRKFISCAPCYQSTLWKLCDDPACMNNIKVDDILKAVFSFKLKGSLSPRVALPPYVEEMLPISQHQDYKSLKVVMPYYSGSSRIDAAVKTWPTENLLLAITDEDAKPPTGYEYFFVDDNAKKRGLNKKTKPMLRSMFQGLLERYPYEDFYGFANSDIVIPPETDVMSLLPAITFGAAVHHRLDVSDITTKKGGALYQAGKDVFILSVDVLKKVVKDFPDLVIGSCNWDDGLVHWLWKTYGHKSIDIRYGEVWHRRHVAGWNGAEKDAHFNGAALEKIGITTALRYSFDWLHYYQEWQKRSRKIGIIQPGRAGDILIALPIAKWYADKGFEVLWPIHSDFLSLFDYVDYVTPIPINKSMHICYEESKKLLHDKVARIFDLGIGFGRNEDGWLKSMLTFDEWKYAEAEVPFEEKQNLQITRKPQKEMALAKKLSLQKPYTLTHSIGQSPGNHNFQKVDAIEIKKIEDFTIFDWLSIIEGAEEIFCINSCIMNLIEGLKIGIKKHVKLQNDAWNTKRDMLLIPHLKSDWLVIKNESQLPVSFFTIVFDGMPFIKYHLERFQRLNFPWHWYIVEGLSHVAGDPGSRGHKRRGGHIPKKYTSHLSSDGTKEYLDELSKLDNVTVIRKADVWTSKLEMINAVLSFLKASCLLWQIDVDEFYPVPVIMRLHCMFVNEPNKTAAAPPFYTFVSKKKVIVSKNTWGSHPYARLWKYDVSCKWKSHEPPVLAASNGFDLMKVNAFNVDSLDGLRYYHYNYVTESQIHFKEMYYGYKGLFTAWSALQKQRGKVKVSDFFVWEGIDDLAVLDDWRGKHIIPV